MEYENPVFFGIFIKTVKIQYFNEIFTKVQKKMVFWPK